MTKRQLGNRNFAKKKRKIEAQPFEGTSEQVLRYEVSELVRNLKSINGEAASETSNFPERDADVLLNVVRLSSTGDALATSEEYPGHVFVVPFCLAGELVRGKVITTNADDNYSNADFVKIVEPTEQRRDDLVGCKYFGKCSGCQLQMITYEDQLQHKKGIVEQAYRAFSNLKPELVPAVGDTMASPMQYGYRTKLTPHFDGAEMEKVNGVKKFVRSPTIGYSMKGRKRVMEIEDCPIGTDVVRKGYQREQHLMSQTFDTYKNGATILLRESTTRVPQSDVTKEDEENDHTTEDPRDPEITTKELVLRTLTPIHTVEKRCISDMNGIATEYIDDFQFQSRAGSFFQNNNSILSTFTSYIREKCIPTTSPNPPLRYLLDAYCGSGLFTITLSSLFTSSLGVDVDPAGIKWARLNAERNSVKNTGFIDADASKLFSNIPFPADQTVIVIDPPRKGCSEDFLNQLLEFGAKRVVYVSCNVNTQARDVGMMVRGVVDAWKVTSREWVEGRVVGGVGGMGVLLEETGGVQKAKCRYEIESLRGCDFFPQTGHVEGVAILNRVDA